SSDFEIIKYYSAKPNFITEKSISSEIIVLDDSKAKSDLKNKIILLENADPGYDWIFTRNPSGLITKYGGVASHMSIRCAELNLPAAIGCGEIIYEQLLLSSKVLLDCKNKQIIILEHEKDDQYVEERRVLKSLGYIR
ncbi:MAG: sugar metabolism cluster protein, partial [Nitrososphaeria archaeon]|nr:sugar metabolism cluster protein [Nitrososphaeria archaeon]